MNFFLLTGFSILGSVCYAQDANEFDLLELRVKGNTLLERKQIEKTVYPFLGPKKNIDTVEAARSALEQLYHTNGYQTIAVDIPEQDVLNGIVNLQITEGKVSRLRVTDSRYFSLGSIKAKVPELAEGHVPNLPKMQEQLAELSKESQDRSIVPIMRAGETPGTLEVDLKVKDELPLHGKVEVNGRNSAGTSRLRTLASVRYDNLWQKFHSASFMYQTSPEIPDEVQVIVGTYVMPLFSSGTRLALYAVSSSSNSQIANAGALSVIGSGNIYGARLVQPLPSLNDYTHTATLGVDYKDFKEDLALLGSDTIKTPIAYLPFIVQYNGNRRGESSLLLFNMGLNFSIRGLGNKEQEFADKRFLAQSNYMYLTGGLNFRQDLPYGMEFASRFSGQIADSPLISNEQFSMGGVDTVRGYHETEALSDDGVTASLELYSPRLNPESWEFVNKLRALVFVDSAKGWVKKALAGNQSHMELASSGVGLNFQLWKYFVGELSIAVPFIEQGSVRKGESRFDFRIASEF
ncbi:MAG: ShlB/FhaC/HecB family hemolysin secretion/activation protein [Methylococcaceae bacterium]|nr:ShlB/FhaC/HecB family hemolysin secretion/activation protein [Methylococcaceae bacterium]